VNCKSIEEVIKTVEENYSQYKLNEEKTTNFKKIKALASFYKRNTLVFVKE
jgi:hypothetical protein